MYKAEKKGKSHTKRKTRKRCHIFSGAQSGSPCRWWKKRGEAKGGKGEDHLAHVRLHRLLIPRALWVRKKTRKRRGSILYWMKINLSGTTCQSLHLVQTLSFSNTSYRKAFMTQSVKCIMYQIIWTKSRKWTNF